MGKLEKIVLDKSKRNEKKCLKVKPRIQTAYILFYREQTLTLTAVAHNKRVQMFRKLFRNHWLLTRLFVPGVLKEG